MQFQDATSSPLPKLAPRPVESHKGDYGRVLIIGGSRGMAGAPALAGRSALRSGAGLVTLVVPRSIQALVSGFEPSYMTLGLGSENDDGLALDHFSEICERAEKMTAIALGPGLSTSDSTIKLTQELYENIEQTLIVDADGLNALAKDFGRLQHPAGLRILTPHPGEFQRLSGKTLAPDSLQRAEQAAELCRHDTTGSTTVVLKGHQTIVTDGQRYAVNHTGNPGMATGGTGDCLTGVITALVGQGLAPWEASRLGVHVHGLAGDLAAQELGQTSMVASDLIDYLPTAFHSLA